MSTTKVCKNLVETQTLARKLADVLLSFPRPVVIFLNGDLGAGKTAFVRAFASVWELESEVTSPTFTLMNQYKGKDLLITHFDLYRLGSEEEAEELGLSDFIADSDFVFIEWPETAGISEPDVEIQISLGSSESERSFRFEFKNTEVVL